jgi:hypothetical protein
VRRAGGGLGVSRARYAGLHRLKPAPRTAGTRGGRNPEIPSRSVTIASKATTPIGIAAQAILVLLGREGLGDGGAELVFGSEAFEALDLLAGAIEDEGDGESVEVVFLGDGGVA